MRNAVHLNALGLVCALGQGKEQISSRLFEEHTGVVTLENAAGNGVSLPFAPVSVSLSDIPVSLRRYASRNLALVLTALAEIESELSEAIARYGEHRVAGTLFLK